ncbi:MAG: ATP-dependent DNA helicase UvrD2 [Brooklawnia sp.]
MSDPIRAEEVLAGLDDQQRAVATTFGSPIVVLAGAGTGKTRAITHRIAHGAFTGQLDPGRTLAVTFTTKAAAELRQRLAALGVPRVQARTFHSAALRQISYFWPRVNGTELPPVEPRTFGLIAQAARGIADTVDTGLLRDLAGEISWAKVTNLVPDRYPVVATRAGRQISGLDAEQVGTVLVRYEQVKKQHQVIDFDDILLCAIGLLHEYPDVAAEIRDQYRHFTVDEYQDVSPVQRTLLDLWLGQGNDDVCVVGDLNQSIHTFAGAQPLFLKNFAKDRPGTVTLHLNTNYRSTPQVLQAANAVIGRGRKLRPTREAGPQTEVVPASDEASEAEDVARWLVAEHRGGLGWQQLAVLYRINAQSEVLQEALGRHQVPFVVRDPDSRERVSTEQAASAVTLSTMHSAKGLEWESVAVVGLSEGLMPFALATGAAALDEERRLLYVALTRARTGLRLSWAAGGVSGRGQREPSRYLRSAGLASGNSSSVGRAQPTRSGRRRRSLPRCRVCSEAIIEVFEIKLGRHLDCEVSFDEELYEQLQTWRAQQASEQSLPAFVVFTDSTLRALAEHRPTTHAELVRIPGVGAVKAERYGADVLGLVARAS